MFVKQVPVYVRMLNIFQRFFHEESGNLESALVLIPTMILFLSVLQIALSALLHGYAINDLQGALSKRALLGSTQISNSSASIGPQNGSGDSSFSRGSSVLSSERIPLPGDGNLLIGTLTRQLPVITPLLPFTSDFTVKSFAVDEN